MRLLRKYLRAICLIAISTVIIIPAVQAGCNAPDGTLYTISITGGSESVADGATSTYTFETTPSVSGVTPTWYLDPTGGGEPGLKTPSIEVSGNSATVNFFWHPDDENYTLICKVSDDCKATKTVNVFVADPMAVISYTYTIKVTGTITSNDLLLVTGCAASTLSGQIDPKILSTGCFWNKMLAHENQHDTDFSGGSGSAAAAYAEMLGNEDLVTENWINREWTLLQEGHMNALLKLFTESALVDWAEQRAYAVDATVAPFYF